jgi:ubiquinone/menaquinone biosynthesis C-methylase UbiE
MSRNSERKLSWGRKQEIRLRYNAQAETYDGLYSAEQELKYNLALMRLVLGGKDRLLDSGCGTGLFLEKIAGSAGTVIGVDISPRMLRLAKVRSRGRPNVHLVCADLDYLPFSGGVFQYVFVFTALSDPPYWRDALSEVLRVLATHGILTVSVPKREMSYERLASELRENGFEPRELVDHKATTDYLAICQKP